jgi:heme/copper-type cytochrome/quinol oxidase subunit 3
MANKKSSNNFIIIGALIALANLALFGLMFTLMAYYELMGADKAYFDEGSINNIKYLNMLTGLFGLHIDPMSQPQITTLGYAVCYGIALVAAGLSIFIACRKPSTSYEVSDPV